MRKLGKKRKTAYVFIDIISLKTKFINNQYKNSIFFLLLLIYMTIFLKIFIVKSFYRSLQFLSDGKNLATAKENKLLLVFWTNVYFLFFIVFYDDFFFLLLLRSESCIIYIQKIKIWEIIFNLVRVCRL